MDGSTILPDGMPPGFFGKGFMSIPRKHTNVSNIVFLTLVFPFLLRDDATT